MESGIVLMTRVGSDPIKGRWESGLSIKGVLSFGMTRDRVVALS